MIMSDDDAVDIASVDRVLSTARSVRRRLDFSRPVEPEVLYECINVCTQAPTGLPGETWRFVVVTDGARKQQIAELYRSTLGDLANSRGLAIKSTQRSLADRLHEVPALVFVCAIGTPPPADVGRQVSFFASVLPSAWSLMLALRARNLGATWTTLLSTRQQEVNRILEVPEGVTQTVMLPVAYTREARLRPAERMDAREVTFWNAWGRQQPD